MLVIPGRANGVSEGKRTQVVGTGALSKMRHSAVPHDRQVGFRDLGPLPSHSRAGARMLAGDDSWGYIDANVSAPAEASDSDSFTSPS